MAESEEPKPDRSSPEALSDLSWALRNLTANLMRIVRGAGRPYDLPAQLGEARRAYLAYMEQHGRPLDYDVHDMLDMNAGNGVNCEGERLPFAYMGEDWHGIETMVRGSLRLGAAKLLRQPLQVTAGDKELMQGFYSIERVRENSARRYAESLKAEKVQPAKGRSKVPKR